MSPTLKTYKFYTKAGRRLAIFGQPKEDDTMLIVVIPCSLDEKSFIKKKANKLYLDLLDDTHTEKVNHEAFNIPIVDGKPGQSLIKWCRKNYYTMKGYISEISYQLLVKDGEPLKGRTVKVKFTIDDEVV